jgi:hypothetical protein
VADADDMAGCVGGLIGLMLIVTAVVIAVMALMSAGAVFGAGVSLRNYFLAFRHNVQPERAVP